MFTGPGMGQSLDCPNASEVISKEMGKTDHYQNKCKPYAYFSWNHFY